MANQNQIIGNVDKDINAKDRTSNFTPSEVARLRDLLDIYKDIILNKKTDHCSIKEKEEAWEKLTIEFNARGTIFRSKNQIKNKFNNLKKAANKNTSEEKKARRQTGGGPPLPKPSDMTEWMVGVMGISIEGRPSEFDSDVLIENNDFPGDNENNTDVLIDDSNADNVIIIPDRPSAEEMKDKEPIKKFDCSTPKAMLRKPLSKPLCQNETILKRRSSCTPYETRKRICALTTHKESHLIEKSSREKTILNYAKEEHERNLDHKEKINTLRLKNEIEHHNKIMEILEDEKRHKEELHKIEIEVKNYQLKQEIEKYIKLKNENKNVD